MPAPTTGNSSAHLGKRLGGGRGGASRRQYATAEGHSPQQTVLQNQRVGEGACEGQSAEAPQQPRKQEVERAGRGSAEIGRQRTTGGEHDGRQPGLKRHDEAASG